MSYIITTDGGSRGNPGLAACAFVVRDEYGKYLYSHGQFLGIKTNNQAEYHAVLVSLEWLENQPERPASVTWQADSMLVVHQIMGDWKIKDVKMRSLREMCYSKLNHLFPDKQYTFVYIPRAENYAADAIVNEILDRQTGGSRLLSSDDAQTTITESEDETTIAF